eukprot:GHVQ01033130.1.p1 GENE.GHVQ01033130.1~~GHVQ01033130.1.p1  ORF type:complete len:226 (+),score=20.01 GHVQ01033130.1:237-914(+)
MVQSIATASREEALTAKKRLQMSNPTDAHVEICDGFNEDVRHLVGGPFHTGDPKQREHLAMFQQSLEGKRLELLWLEEQLKDRAHQLQEAAANLGRRDDHVSRERTALQEALSSLRESYEQQSHRLHEYEKFELIQKSQEKSVLHINNVSLLLINRVLRRDKENCEIELDSTQAKTRLLEQAYSDLQRSLNESLQHLQSGLRIRDTQVTNTNDNLHATALRRWWI